MEAANQAQTEAREDGTGGVEGEEYGGEVGRVGLEEVLAVEDGETLGVGALGREEDVGGQMHWCGGWGSQVVGVAGDDGGVVREQEAEDLIADFAGELEEGEGHWDGGD